MDTKTLLKNIGGQAAIARQCGIEDSAVSQWASNDSIPAARLQYLRLARAGKHWAEYDKYIASRLTQITEDKANHYPDLVSTEVTPAQVALKTAAPQDVVSVSTPRRQNGRRVESKA